MVLNSISSSLVLISGLFLQSARADIGSITELEKFLNQNKIKNVNTFLEKMPVEMKSNFMLVYDSHALNADLVTPEKPRILLINQNQAMVITVIGEQSDQNLAASESLEVIDFDPSKAKYATHLIQFDDGQNAKDAYKVTHNPTQCLTCHGQNPRPLLLDYNTWPGFYGSYSQNGLATEGSKEYVWLKKFLQFAPVRARYQKLDFSNFTLVNESGGRGIMQSKTVDDTAPVWVLSKAIEGQMRTRMAATLVKNKNYSNLRPIFEYLGSDSKTECGTRNVRNKKLYQAWNEMGSLTANQVAKLRDGLVGQVTLDFNTKLKEFNRFNIEEKRFFDARGLFTTTYLLAVLGSDVYYGPLDKEFSQNQLVFIESLFQSASLKREDVTSSNTLPTAGLLHFSFQTPAENENYFWSLAEELAKQDPSFEARIENCEKAYEVAVQSLKRIVIPNIHKSGILYQGN